MNKYIKLTLWIVVFLAVSFGIGQLTQANIASWYQALEKPSLNPPNIAFPVVWSILYVLIATAGWALWQSKHTVQLKKIFIAYISLNWLWSFVFFGAHLIFTGFVWIMAVNFVNLTFIVKSWKVARLSAILMVFPLLWTCFAAYLNFMIWQLNG